MIKKIPVLAATLFLSALSAPSQAADPARGETLHNGQCVACHAARFGNNGAEIYTRDNRRVTDLNALKRQVERCKNNLQITWFDEDVADVAEYLNRTYYRFGQ